MHMMLVYKAVHLLERSKSKCVFLDPPTPGGPSNVRRTPKNHICKKAFGLEAQGFGVILTVTEHHDGGQGENDPND